MTEKTTTIPATIAERVAEVRERRGYSLRELSRRLEEIEHTLAPSALMRLEEGERRPTLADVVALALALDCSPNALILPLADDVRIELTPTYVRPVRAVRDWFEGRTLLLPTQASEKEIRLRRDAWRAERPLVERRAMEHDGVATLMAETHRFVQSAGAPSSSPVPLGERRRALEALRAAVGLLDAELQREEAEAAPEWDEAVQEQRTDDQEGA